MSDNVLQQFTGRLAKNPTNHTEDSDAADDCGSFGYLRGVRDRALFLELRRKDGNIIALGYAWLERVEYDASIGLILHFTGLKVKVAGRNLNAEVRPNLRLVDALCRHRVPWIKESEERDVILASKQSIVIEALHIE
jgi:hypothetical protein